MTIENEVFIYHKQDDTYIVYYPFTEHVHRIGKDVGRNVELEYEKKMNNLEIKRENEGGKNMENINDIEMRMEFDKDGKRKTKLQENLNSKSRFIQKNSPSKPTPNTHIKIDEQTLEKTIKTCLTIKKIKVQEYVNNILTKTGYPGNWNDFTDICIDENILPSLCALCITKRDVDFSFVKTGENIIYTCNFQDDDVFSNLYAVMEEVNVFEVVIDDSRYEYLFGSYLVHISSPMKDIQREFIVNEFNMENSSYIKNETEIVNFSNSKEESKTVNSPTSKSSWMLKKFFNKNLPTKHYKRPDIFTMDNINDLFPNIDNYFPIKTVQGHRLLKQFLRQPLIRVDEIINRQKIIKEFENIEINLNIFPDLYKITKRVINNKVGVNEIMKVYEVILRIPYLMRMLYENGNNFIDDDRREHLFADDGNFINDRKIFNEDEKCENNEFFHGNKKFHENEDKNEKKNSPEKIFIKNKNKEHILNNLNNNGSPLIKDNFIVPLTNIYNNLIPLANLISSIIDIKRSTYKQTYFKNIKYTDIEKINLEMKQEYLRLISVLENRSNNMKTLNKGRGSKKGKMLDCNEDLDENVLYSNNDVNILNSEDSNIFEINNLNNDDSFNKSHNTKSDIKNIQKSTYYQKIIKLENEQFRITRTEYKKNSNLLQDANILILNIHKTGVLFTTKRLSELVTIKKEIFDNIKKESLIELNRIRNEMKKYVNELEVFNYIISLIDVFKGFSSKSHWCKPEFNMEGGNDGFKDNEYENKLVKNDSFSKENNVYVKKSKGHSKKENILNQNNQIIIKKMFHPLLETKDVIYNDFSSQKRMCIVTGPNMGGKSTYLKTIGTICLLAQVGCNVPCEYARLNILDGIFIRIGANDCASKNESTFMVEMKDISKICRMSTNRSLVLIDELGRGTSEIDGLSIAMAVKQYLLDLNCYSIFATHFPELCDENVENVKALYEDNVMVYKIGKGVCDMSYGFRVAEIVGFPEDVLENIRKGTI